MKEMDSNEGVASKDITTDEKNNGPYKGLKKIHRPGLKKIQRPGLKKKVPGTGLKKKIQRSD
jgi:hypothetical protein